MGPLTFNRRLPNHIILIISHSGCRVIIIISPIFMFSHFNSHTILLANMLTGSTGLILIDKLWFSKCTKSKSRQFFKRKIYGAAPKNVDVHKHTVLKVTVNTIIGGFSSFFPASQVLCVSFMAHVIRRWFIGDCWLDFYLLLHFPAFCAVSTVTLGSPFPSRKGKIE